MLPVQWKQHLAAGNRNRATGYAGPGISLRNLQKLSRQIYLVIAATGQISAQVPQSVHFSGSITYLSLPSLMAPAGQLASHAPHEAQSVPILYAMWSTPLRKRQRPDFAGRHMYSYSR